MREDRPDIREQIAVACNASDLSPDSHAARVNGAMGASALRMAYVPERDRLEAVLTAAGTAAVNPRRRLAALLERARYAGDRGAERPAVLLFARHLSRQRGWCNRARVKSGSDLLIRVARVVIVEWIYDRCPQCGGAGWVRLGQGRNAGSAQCGVCRGSGRGKVDHATRASVVGVGMESYRSHWERRFEEAHRSLADIEGCNITALQRQMSRDTLPAVGD